MAIDSKVLENYRKLDWEGALKKDLGTSGELVEGKSSFNRMKKLFNKLVRTYSSGNLLSEYERVLSVSLVRLISFINNSLLTPSWHNEPDNINDPPTSSI